MVDVTIDLLQAAANAALPGTDVGFAAAVAEPREAGEGWDVVARADGLRVRMVRYPDGATDQQKAAARAAVLAASVAQTEGQKLDRLGPQPRVIAAMLIRASSGWTSLSNARKARVMQIIDDAAQQAVALLS